MPRLLEGDGRRDEQLLSGARIVGRIRRALGGGDVARLLDEPGELSVGDRVLVHPEPVHADPVDSIAPANQSSLVRLPDRRTKQGGRGGRARLHHSFADVVARGWLLRGRGRRGCTARRRSTQSRPSRRHTACPAQALLGVPRCSAVYAIGTGSVSTRSPYRGCPYRPGFSLTACARRSISPRDVIATWPEFADRPPHVVGGLRLPSDHAIPNTEPTAPGHM
jgi:hypothetical protein